MQISDLDFSFSFNSVTGALNLSRTGLAGPLPIEFSFAASLGKIARIPQGSSRLPLQLDQVAKVIFLPSFSEELELSGNQFAGPIPAEFGSLNSFGLFLLRTLYE